jgi:hypothetical protein
MTGFLSRLRALLPGSSPQPSDRASLAAPEQRGCASFNGAGGSSFIELHMLLNPRWGMGNTSAFAREGFAANPVAYRCITMIARAVAAVPLKSEPPEEEATSATRAAAEALKLLRRPNALQSGRELIEALIAHVLIAGNGWLKATLVDGRPLELHVLNPERVEIITDRDGWPVAWDYEVEGKRVRLRQRADDPIAPVMQLRLFSPFSDIEGLSPFAPAARAVDIHNAAASWCKALLDNAARPSGAIIYRGEGPLSREQFERLREELQSTYAGAANAGRPLVLEGGCRMGPPGCRLHGDELEIRLRVEPHALRLISNLPLDAASAQLLHEEERPPPLVLYSVGHRKEWAAAQSDPLAEFPGEPVTLLLSLIRGDRLYTATLTAETDGN